MKKKLFLAALFLNLSIVPSVISPSGTFVTKAVASEIPDIQPYVKETGYKYKIINGKLHKRLWSFKHNKWLEPEWTPVE